MISHDPTPLVPRPMSLIHLENQTHTSFSNEERIGPAGSSLWAHSQYVLQEFFPHAQFLEGYHLIRA